MNDHPARLIDYNNVLVLIENIERDILRCDHNLLGGRHGAADFLPAAQLIIRFDRRAIHTDIAVRDEALHIAARAILHLARKEYIQTFSRRVRNISVHRGSSLFCTNNAHSTAAVPITMAMSAMLNTGHTRKSKKSTTCPVRTRSIILLTAPAARATLP